MAPIGVAQNFKLEVNFIMGMGMNLNSFGTRLLLLMVTVHSGVQGDCWISRNMVEQSNRIFTYCDTEGNIQLQRTEMVPSGATLHMICTLADVVETSCQDNGQFSVPLPMRCDNPMRPVPTLVSDSGCRATMYAVGYVINHRLLEIYRSCIDAKNMQVLYSESDVYHKSFFPKRPQQTPFLTDGIFTPAEEAAFAVHRMYNAFKCIFGDHQCYIPSHRSFIINRGHLVASADFLFADQMTSTFRYLNVVPQFKSINDGNWEKIERWVRSQIPSTAPYRIKTGGINILRLPDDTGQKREAYLIDSKIPVPEWIYKIVKNAHLDTLHIFLIYNNVFEQQRPLAPEFCFSVQCPLSLPDTPNNGFTFCCDSTTFSIV